MNARRLLPLLALLALLIAPFGRMTAAEAMTTPHPAGMAMPEHCDKMPTPDEGTPAKAIDCMIACAVMVPAGSVAALEIRRDRVAAESPPVRPFRGITPEADPPPPRFS